MILQYVYLLLLAVVLPGLFMFVATRTVVELIMTAPRRSAGSGEQELRERIAALELETRALRNALVAEAQS